MNENKTQKRKTYPNLPAHTSISSVYSGCFMVDLDLRDLSDFEELFFTSALRFLTWTSSGSLKIENETVLFFFKLGTGLCVFCWKEELTDKPFLVLFFLSPVLPLEGVWRESPFFKDLTTFPFESWPLLLPLFVMSPRVLLFPGVFDDLDSPSPFAVLALFCEADLFFKEKEFSSLWMKLFAGVLARDEVGPNADDELWNIFSNEYEGPV